MHPTHKNCTRTVDICCRLSSHLPFATLAFRFGKSGDNGMVRTKFNVLKLVFSAFSPVFHFGRRGVGSSAWVVFFPPSKLVQRIIDGRLRESTHIYSQASVARISSVPRNLI